MIECGSCGTDALVLDRSGAWGTDDELVVLCAECAPGETVPADFTAAFAELPLRASHARAA